MVKDIVHFFLAALLLTAVVSQSMAADEAGSAPLDSPAVTETPPANPADSPPVEGSASNAGEPEKIADMPRPNVNRGKYFGGKFGINNSRASGAVNVPSATTLAYGLQGGYLQGGYSWDLNYVVAGIGAYFDWNNYTLHSNGVAYSSHAYGLDARLGVPIEDWLPYIKVGYGYSSGSQEINLRTVSQTGRNLAAGFEYNFAPRWSVIAEYKTDKFSNRDGSITILNRIFSFGFNYYFDMPAEEMKKVEIAPEPDLPIPAPELAPDALPDAPPPP